MFQQGETRGLSKIQFHDYRIAYDSVDLPNVTICKEQIFDFMVRDFSEFALKLYVKPDTNEDQMKFCEKIIKKPVMDQDRFNRILSNHVMVLKDTYEMNP